MARAGPPATGHGSQCVGLRVRLGELDASLVQGDEGGGGGGGGGRGRGGLLHRAPDVQRRGEHLEREREREGRERQRATKRGEGEDHDTGLKAERPQSWGDRGAPLVCPLPPPPPSRAPAPALSSASRPVPGGGAYLRSWHASRCGSTTCFGPSRCTRAAGRRNTIAAADAAPCRRSSE